MLVAHEALFFDGGDQLAVEIVGPGVVGALDRARRLARVLGAQAGAAMAADVVVDTDLAVVIADDDDRVRADVDGDEVAVGGRAIDVADYLNARSDLRSAGA